MAPTPFLSHSDVYIAHTVCEIRYEMAFLIFDRTGAICMECKEQYPELELLRASPAGTHFEAGPYGFGVEQATSRIVCAKPRIDPKTVGEASSKFFEIVLRQLEIRTLTRIGLRLVFYKPYEHRDEAAAMMEQLNLEANPSDNHFGIAGRTKESVLRWETSDVGTMMHVIALPDVPVLATVDVLQLEARENRKFESALVFDVDYYTKAPVLRSQWDPAEWVAQSTHVLKKGFRSFLDQCQVLQQK